jgi:hypothetical protein
VTKDVAENAWQEKQSETLRARVSITKSEWRSRSLRYKRLDGKHLFLGLRWFNDDGCIVSITPLIPACVVVAHGRRAHQLHREDHHGSSAARLTVACGWPLQFYASFPKEYSKLSGSLKPLSFLVDQVDPFQVLGSGDRPGTLVRLLVGSAKLGFGAGIHDLKSLVLQGIEELPLRGQPFRLRHCLESLRRGRLRLVGLNGEPGCFPARPSSIEKTRVRYAPIS